MGFGPDHLATLPSPPATLSFKDQPEEMPREEGRQADVDVVAHRLVGGRARGHDGAERGGGRRQRPQRTLSVLEGRSRVSSARLYAQTRKMFAVHLR